MTDVSAVEDPPAKGSFKPLLISLFAAVLLGGATFSALFFDLPGMLGGGAAHDTEAAHAPGDSTADNFSFLAIPALTISLSRDAANRHLRFLGQLEVEADHAETVAHLMPRVSDVLNSYLSALDARDVEKPAALVNLRAQMLRRVQLVTGSGMVRDLLVTEFVLN